MKVIMALALSALLLQQSALAARYEDDDDDDEPTRAKVLQPAQPQTPATRYKARLELLKDQIQIRRDDCKVRSATALEFCGREIDQAELEGRHRLEVQYKEELAKEAGGSDR